MKRVVLQEEDVPGAQLLKGPAKCTVEELKRWLECHGLKKGGEKDELVERVRLSNGVIKVDPKIDRGKWYDQKANPTGNPSDKQDNVLYGESETNWHHFPSQNVPRMFNYGHIYHYIVESIDSIAMDVSGDEDEPNSLSDVVTARPMKKGRCLVDSGFVDDVHDATSSGTGDYHLRGHVHHSMKRELPLNVSLVISGMSGCIKKAPCTCKANAAGRCAHVTALLLFLDDHIKENGYTATVTCTEEPCVWNQGRKRDKNPQPIHQAAYKSVTREMSTMYNFDPRPTRFRGIDMERSNQFVRELESYSSKTGEKPMWLTLFQVTYADFVPDAEDRSCYSQMMYQFVSNLYSSIQSDEPFQIPGTQGQSKSQEWTSSRWPRITASICRKVARLGANLNLSDCYKWLKANIWFKEELTTPDMAYGIEEESNAVAAYSRATLTGVIPSGL